MKVIPPQCGWLTRYCEPVMPTQLTSAESILWKEPLDPFGNICCRMGQHRDLAAPQQGLAFGNMTLSWLHVDANYIPFHSYPIAKTFKILDSTASPFLSEAFESIGSVPNTAAFFCNAKSSSTMPASSMLIICMLRSLLPAGRWRTG